MSLVGVGEHWGVSPSPRPIRHVREWVARCRKND
jgi:hypothetical protein